MKLDYISLILPMPPSVNIAYSWKVRRYKSDEYKNWIELANIEYLKNWFKWVIRWDKWLEVSYNYFYSLYTLKWKKRVKDLGNYEKLLTDFLCSKIEWLKDEHIKVIKLEKHDSDKNIVKILIKEL